VVDGSSHNPLTVPSEDLLENAEGKQESSLGNEPLQGQEIDTQESGSLNEPLKELLPQVNTDQMGGPSSVEENVNFSGGQEISEAIEASKADSEPLVDHQEVTIDKIFVNGENGSSNSEPLEKTEDSLPRPQSELPFELKSEPPNSLIFKPLPGKIVAKRLGYHPDSLSKIKTRSTDEEFLALSSDKDPDYIAWKFVKKGRGYLPANELSSELQRELLGWLKENFPEYSP
jgi:hypothetical protein